MTSTDRQWEPTDTQVAKAMATILNDLEDAVRAALREFRGARWSQIMLNEREDIIVYLLREQNWERSPLGRHYSDYEVAQHLRDTSLQVESMTAFDRAAYYNVSEGSD